MRLQGRARDVITPLGGGDPIICAEDSFEVTLRADRTILAIRAEPPRAALAKLVGSRGGGHLRHALEDIVPEERVNATPLYLILDDISGISLIAPWAWSQWSSDWLDSYGSADDRVRRIKSMKGVCTGFAPGSSGLNLDRSEGEGGAHGPDLRRSDDPKGWHDFPAAAGAGMRRARRIDVSIEDGLTIRAAFQDSAATPEGARAVLHEYELEAGADPDSLQLLRLEATPRVLPLPECPGATRALPRLLGARLPELRREVLEKLPGVLGCTHLNDALRALAEVPVLAARCPRPE